MTGKTIKLLRRLLKQEKLQCYVSCGDRINYPKWAKDQDRKKAECEQALRELKEVEE